MDTVDEKSRDVRSLNMTESLKSIKISLETYKSEVWPLLQASIQKVLTTNHTNFYTDSYETFYRNVLRVVLSGLSAVLSSDVNDLISQHLTLLNNNLFKEYLSGTSGTVPLPRDSVRYVIAFNKILLHFNNAVDYTILICLRVSNVMSREDFNKLFRITIADKHVNVLIPLLADLQLKSFSVDPDVMQTIVTSLYALSPDYSQLRPCLFERFIANFNPLSLSHLEHHRKEVLRMCQDLKNHPNFHGGDQSKKRRLSES